MAEHEPTFSQPPQNTGQYDVLSATIEADLADYEASLAEKARLMSLHWAKPDVKEAILFDKNRTFIDAYDDLRRERGIEEMYPDIIGPRTVSSG